MESLAAAGYRQGGDLRGMRGVTPLDLSTCVNRYGPHPAALAALTTIRAAELRAHPYTAAEDFLDAYGDFLGVPGSELLPLRGITEGLRLIADLFPYAAVVCPDYTESIRLFWHVPSSFDPRQRVVSVEQALARYPVVVLSNPNNPGGGHISSRELIELAIAHPESLLVVDEAYADFLDERDTLLGVELDNVVVLRAPNKILGMAGVRTGALWTRNPMVAQAVTDRLLTWPIGMLDGVAVTAALRAPEWVEATRRELLSTAGWLGKRLNDLFGDDAVASDLHFRFLQRNSIELDALWHHLGRHNIVVRTFPHAEPGRVLGMRIVAPTAAEWSQLEYALADF